jgi:hypothetical protein
MADNNWQQKALATVDDAWMLNAKCRKEKKSTPFFFEDFERSTPAVKNKMVYFCASCAVVEDCYQHAVTVGETGLWGGTYFLAGKPKNPLKARYLEIQRDRASAKKVS